MFKVMCINDAGWINEIERYDTDGPCYGDVDTVIRCERDRNLIGYFLQRFGMGASFLSTEFIRLSDIDETEMVRNYQTEKI